MNRKQFIVSLFGLATLAFVPEVVQKVAAPAPKIVDQFNWDWKPERPDYPYTWQICGGAVFIQALTDAIKEKYQNNI